MIAPDDPRHGSNPGYIAGCREACCRAAHATYRRRLRDRQYLAGGHMQIDGTGTFRRFQALVAMGYPLDMISIRLGRCKSWGSHLLRAQKGVHRRTAREVSALYDEWSMTAGPSDQARKSAKRRGWAGPLAWDDDTIDDPDAQPYREPEHVPRADDIDEVLVQRAMSGRPVTATKAERLEIIRRWQEAGRPTLELERILPTANIWRDIREARAA